MTDEFSQNFQPSLVSQEILQRRRLGLFLYFCFPVATTGKVVGGGASLQDEPDVLSKGATFSKWEP